MALLQYAAVSVTGVARARLHRIAYQVKIDKSFLQAAAREELLHAFCTRLFQHLEHEICVVFRQHVEILLLFRLASAVDGRVKSDQNRFLFQLSLVEQIVVVVTGPIFADNHALRFAKHKILCVIQFLLIIAYVDNEVFIEEMLHYIAIVHVPQINNFVSEFSELRLKFSF